MISRVGIRNFQSLKNIDIELGAFTVIVGDSASGKSAFTRALKAVSSNIRGSSFITLGQSSSSVLVESEDWRITLQKSGSSSSYKVCDLSTGLEKEYTKLAGEVPEDVTSLLGIEPFTDGRSVNFSGEREQPYLVDDSGQQVAKVLGDLTNVSTILEAVREANRRRTASNSTLRIRVSDLDKLKQRVPRFKSLPSQRALLQDAEEKFTRLEDLSTSLSALQDLVAKLEEINKFRYVTIAEIPDTAELEYCFHKMQDLFRTASSLNQINVLLPETHSSIERSIQDTEVLRLEYNETLVQLGECPTCQQPITHL